MERILIVMTFVAAVGSALIAGIFFAFSTFIMAALGRLPAAVGISAMQSINVVILNVWFLPLFFGTGVVCIVLAIAALSSSLSPFYLVAGSLLYLVGGLLVTMVFNVPLNNALAAADPNSADGAVVWKRYLSIWTAWNHVRTVACLVAAASFITALG